MSNKPNWENLVEKGRAKAFGVPWDEQELKAIYELKIPVDYVREGCLTLEEYNQETKQIQEITQEKGEKPLRYMNKPELIEIAKTCGLEVTEAAKKTELIHLIEVAQKKSESKLPNDEEIV